MHELSIVLGIVEVARQEFAKIKASRVSSIELEIGKLSGVEPMALDFAWPEATKNTLLENAERIIEYIPGKARCSECGETFELENIFDECPFCHGYFKDILAGRELRVKALSVI